MTMRLIGKLKLTGIMLAVLIVAAACSSGSADRQQDGAASDSTVATTVPAGDTSGSSADQAAADNAVDKAPAVGADGTSDAVGETAAVVEEADAAVEQATGALFLEMLSPDTDELFVTQSSYEFSGRTTVDALLSVNDSVLDVDEEGRFAFAVELEEGPNVIEVVASNALGEQFDEVLLVIYEPA